MDGIQQIKRNIELLSFLYCSDACVLLYLLYTIKKTLQWKWNQVHLHCISWYLRALNFLSLSTGLPSGKTEKLKAGAWEVPSEEIDEPELKHKTTSQFCEITPICWETYEETHTHLLQSYSQFHWNIQVLKRFRNLRKAGQLNIWESVCCECSAAGKLSSGNTDISYWRTERTDELTVEMWKA